MTADADDEMREAIAGAIEDETDPSLELSAHQAAIIALRVLRRRGAWLPGDPVTDAMCNAAWYAWLGLDCVDPAVRPPVHDWQRANAARTITAALAAIPATHKRMDETT